jgi:hypothetical protein
LVNISVTVLPKELQVWFYRYGIAFPVHNMSQAIRTIIFNTKNHLGRNFGVLLAWVVLSLITLPALQYLMRRREIAAESVQTQGNCSKESVLDIGRCPTPEDDEKLEKNLENAEVHVQPVLEYEQ